MDKLNNLEYPNLLYCPFPSWVGATNPYFCYYGEKCCDDGCCVTINRMGNAWYYWVMIMFLCGVICIVLWYCKQCWKSSPMRQDNPNTCHMMGPMCPANTSDSNDVVLNRLFVSYRNKDPPSYNTVTKQDQNNPINFYEPPPQYSSSTSNDVHAQIPVEIHQHQEAPTGENK